MTDPDDLEALVDDAEQQADWGDDDTDEPATIDAEREESFDEESTDF